MLFNEFVEDNIMVFQCSRVYSARYEGRTLLLIVAPRRR